MRGISRVVTLRINRASRESASSNLVTSNLKTTWTMVRFAKWVTVPVASALRACAKKLSCQAIVAKRSLVQSAKPALARLAFAWEMVWHNVLQVRSCHKALAVLQLVQEVMTDSAMEKMLIVSRSQALPQRQLKQKLFQQTSHNQCKQIHL
jgi:hypothetical protein